MYGTLAELKVMPGRHDRLAAQMNEYRGLDVPGLVGSYLLRSNDDPSTCYLMAVFEDQASYVANAESPDQHERYLAMRSLLTEDPVWHDGDYLASLP